MIYVTLDSIRCHEETAEVGPDEPYVIVAAVDLANTIAIGGQQVPSPRTVAVRYGPFGDVDGQETHYAGFQSFWGLYGEERSLSNLDDAIFMVGLMENDSGNAEALRGIVAAQVTGAIAASAGADRRTRVGLVQRAFISAEETPTGFPNLDERIGDPQELRFTPDEIDLAETGNPAYRSIRVRGDDGDYTMTFKAIDRGQAAWRFCFRCRTMFFDGYADNKGRCPAGGGHAAAGWVFYLPHDHPGPLGGQDQWRYCGGCNAMFWDQEANKGVCPAGGGHRAVGYMFFLPHDHNGAGQDEWRYCVRCRGMFYDRETNKGVCPAGGGHSAAGYNFKLDYTP